MTWNKFAPLELGLEQDIPPFLGAPVFQHVSFYFHYQMAESPVVLSRVHPLSMALHPPPLGVEPRRDWLLWRHSWVRSTQPGPRPSCGTCGGDPVSAAGPGGAATHPPMSSCRVAATGAATRGGLPWTRCPSRAGPHAYLFPGVAGYPYRFSCLR